MESHERKRFSMTIYKQIKVLSEEERKQFRSEILLLLEKNSKEELEKALLKITSKALNK